MKTFLPVILIFATAGLSLSCAPSTILLRGDQGMDFIRTHDRLYPINRFTCLDIRRTPGGRLQLAVLNTDEGRADSGNFYWIKKGGVSERNFAGNQWNVLLLDSPGGERGKPLTQELLTELGETRLTSTVVLSRQRRLKAIVYHPASVSLKAFIRAEGVVRLEFGQRRASQGDIKYTLTLFEKSVPEEKTQEQKEEDTIRNGDLVSWEIRGRTRAGVVKEIKPNGNCVVNVPTTGGSREERVPLSHLKVLTPAPKK